ncbi:expressed protein [Echinococcus multilocularis]|uniref:Expressed protein n=1 Tax=Echinococcus multilocularis TaxID=6211 RepID=A0A087W1X4_ECHMU|nr:expressed protein [Echinococcus multilocularis]
MLTSSANLDSCKKARVETILIVSFLGFIFISLPCTDPIPFACSLAFCTSVVQDVFSAAIFSFPYVIYAMAGLFVTHI